GVAPVRAGLRGDSVRRRECDGDAADGRLADGGDAARDGERFRLLVAVERAVAVAVYAETAARAGGHARESQLRARVRRVDQLLRRHHRRAAAVGLERAAVPEEAARLALEAAFDDHVT